MSLVKCVTAGALALACLSTSAFAKSDVAALLSQLNLAAIALYVRDAPECQNGNNLAQSCCIDGVYQEVGCGINADGSRRTGNVGMGCCLAGAR